jgi:predicted Holliday junction resolvase-like endonuclease
LSTLTKVLIVLVSIFSLFLCGVVASYVVTADNYKQQAETNNRKWQSAKNTQESAERAKEAADKTVEATKADLGTKLTERETQITKLQGDLDTASRLNAELQQKVASMADIMANASAAVKQQTTLHEAAQQKVNTLEADRINREKELAETSQSLLEKMTIIAQHEDTIRRLTQENQDLGTRLNVYLAKYGKMAAQPPTTVAPGVPGTRPVQPIAAPVQGTKALGLNGQVTAVDLRSRLVEISIGTAAGVRQDITFHITRGDQYVADIQIVEVWPDRAVGVLNLVKQGAQPQAGDKVTTNL